MRRASAARAAPTLRKRCAIYTRKSTIAGLEQEFNTLDAQREACEAYIRSQAGSGWFCLDERYDDGGFTGANIDRPAFRRLLADVDARLVDTIVVYKLDRISRSLLDFATVMNRLTKAGVGFVSVTQNFSTDNAVGRMTLNLLATFAEFEREQIGERTRDKMAASRRRGRWTGGQVPIGYKVVDKKLVVVDSEADVVREIFALYLEKRSVLSVALTLNDRGRRTKQHLAATGRMREAREWGKGDVLQVLKAPLYAGYMRCGQELHDGEHAPIVDRLTFEKAKALLPSAYGGRKPRRRNPEYLLSGLLRCALCGSALTAASAHKAKGEYRYYRCTTRDRRGRKACATKPVSAPAIETYVTDQLRRAIVDRSLASEAEHATRCLTLLKRTRAEEADRIAAAISAATAPPSSSNGGAAARGKRALAPTELHLLDRQLADVERQTLDANSALAETAWIASCLRDFDKVWDVLSVVNRGRLFRSVIDRVEVDETSSEIRIELVDLEGAVRR